MGIFTTSLNGPLALNAANGENTGSGVSMKLWEATWSRGEIVQFLNAALASVNGVETGNLRGQSGTLMNAGILVDGTDGFAGVVTSKNDVVAGQEGDVQIDGSVLAMVFLEEVATSGVHVAVNEGDPIYLVEGQPYLSVTAAITGETIGRKVGVVLETLATDARTIDAAHLLRCYFSGIPEFCR